VAGFFFVFDIVVCEKNLLEFPEVYLETGDHTKVRYFTGEQFLQLAEEMVIEEISRHL
jgi:hypothetical protein